MTTWRPDDDVLISDSEDEDGGMFQGEHYGREAMLFVVDAKLNENEDRFAEALSIIKSAFISGMLVSDKELMGVVFANTEMSPEPYEPGCIDNISVPRNSAVFLPLRQLNKPIVEHFLRFEATAQQEFGKEYGVADGSFAAMIRLCLNLFENCSYKVAFAKIVLLTDRTMPHPPHTFEYENALLKAKDLEGKEIDFYVIPMIDEFDYEPFYKEFLALSKDVELDGFVVPDAKQQRDLLTERKLKKNFRKRSMGHFNFSIGPNLAMSAQYYQFYQSRSYPRKVTLLRKDNSVLQRKYVMMVRKQDTESQAVVAEHQVKVTGGWYEINLGDMPIRITPERINRVRNLHSPGMMLLGFKSLDELPKNWYYLPCNFMYPDDNFIVGSKRLFRALWERCHERKKIAICLFMRKRKSIPRYVALKAISIEDTEIKNSSPLDGFKIIYLPFAKHIRNIDFSDWNSIENTSPDEGVALFEQVIRKLKINYEPDLISDPVLEQLQSKLIAMAFDIRVEESNLKQVANAEKQDERIAKFIPDFERLFGEDLAASKKRPASGTSAAGNSAKIPKLTEEDLKTYEKIQSLIENKALATCTVAQLRMILEGHFSVSMPKSANKQTLIDRICELA